MVSHKKIFLATVVLVVAAVSSHPQPPQPQHVSTGPAYSVVDAEEEPADRQAGIAVALGTILLPVFTSLLSSLTSNIGTAVTNAFGATMAGAKLELIPVEVMMAGSKHSPWDSLPLQPIERRRHTPPPPNKAKAE